MASPDLHGDEFMVWSHTAEKFICLACKDGVAAGSAEFAVQARQAYDAYAMFRAARDMMASGPTWPRLETSFGTYVTPTPTIPLHDDPV